MEEIMPDAVFYDDQEDEKVFMWEDFSKEQQDYFILMNKISEFKKFRNKFPTWEGKGFKVRGNNKKTQYAYGNDIEHSKSRGWKEIYINPKERQISMFVALVNKKLWSAIPFRYQWYDNKSIMYDYNSIDTRDSNIYNMRFETEKNIAMFWIYNKFAIKNSNRNNDCQLLRHNKILEALENLLSDYEPEIIDSGYVPNPWFYHGVIVERKKCHSKTTLNFNNILTTDEYEIANKKAIKKANISKIKKAKNKLFSVKTEYPLSVRKLANLAKVSVNTVQKYRKELEDKNLLKKVKMYQNPSS